MRVDTKYELGEIVYLKTDPDQQGRMITQISLRPGHIFYELSCGSNSSWHFEVEFTTERDIIKATS